MKTKQTKPECIIAKDRTKYWYLNDTLHRETGPAIEYPDGSKVWYLHGKMHREDGPAVEFADGEKHWYSYDYLHREDGPAVEGYDGINLWYLNGKEYSERDYYKELYQIGKIAQDEYFLHCI